MALLFADGFDLYADATDASAGGWLRQSADATFSTTDGRFGGGCLTGDDSNSGAWHRALFVPSGEEIISGHAYWHNGAGGATDLLLNVFADVTSGGLGSATSLTCFRLEHNTSGDLIARDSAGTQVGSTATGALPASTWVWVEIKVLLSNGGAGTLEVRVDGVAVIGPVGSLNTLPANAAGADYILYRGGGGVRRMDDIVVLDGTGSTMNDFLGDTRIDTLRPVATGGVMNWSVNTGLDEDAVETADDDTTYIHSSTAGQEARFDMGDLTVEPNTIHGIQVRTRGRKPDAGVRTYRALVNSGGTEAVAGTLGFPADYAWRRDMFLDEDPDTAAVWDAAGVNALEVGVEIVS